MSVDEEWEPTPRRGYVFFSCGLNTWIRIFTLRLYRPSRTRRLLFHLIPLLGKSCLNLACFVFNVPLFQEALRL